MVRLFLKSLNFKKHRRLIVVIVSLCLIVAFFFLWILWPLPAPFHDTLDRSPLKILDRNGALLYEFRSSDFGAQEFLPLANIPPDLLRITLAVEDRSFYQHSGISLKGILRAAWQNANSSSIVSGGSTITQQLVRIRLQPKRRGYFYKLKEILLALKLETRASKDQILEEYLNSAYFGHQAYGVQAGSHIYFSKNVDELSIPEMALLVGLIQSPTSYDPFEHFDLAKKRQKAVLASLQDVGMISAEEKEEYEKQPIRLGLGKVNIRAPHFVMWVRTLALSPFPRGSTRLYGGRGGESRAGVRTTLDLSLQSDVERIVENQLYKLKDKNVTSAAVVVLDAQTGDVLSIVGSADYFNADNQGAVNVALSARQPGSTLKPFTYALALKKGDTAASTVADVETQFFTQTGNPYTPRNYDYGYHGLVRYREALANSYNIAAVKVLQKVGVETLLEFLKKAGLTTLQESPEHYGIALTLGDGEVKLLELTQAYGIFARGGKTLSVRAFLDEPASEGRSILDPRIAWLIADILSDPEARRPEFGEGSALDFDFPVAAKTGTTRNSRDNWTIGLTPDRVVGVWVGNADNTPMKNTSGVTGAGPIFHDVMLAATQGRPHAQFSKPHDMIEKEVCRLSGKLPTSYCTETLSEWFLAGTEPRISDDMFVPIAIDRRNGLRASESCPPEYVEPTVFTIFPPEVRTWARENGWKEAPAAYSPLCPNARPPLLFPPLTRGGLGGSGEDWVTIQKPHVSESFLLDPLVPDKNEKIIFEAEGGHNVDSIDWFVNDQNIGSAQKPNYRLEWSPSPGGFKIEARSKNSSDHVNIEVLKPQ